jgi:hypothetical protein
MNKFLMRRSANYSGTTKTADSTFNLKVEFTDDYAEIVGNLYKYLETLLDTKKQQEKEPKQ